MKILFILGIILSFLGTGYMMWVQHQQHIAIGTENQDEELSTLENDMWIAVRVSYTGYALTMVYLLYSFVII